MRDQRHWGPTCGSINDLGELRIFESLAEMGGSCNFCKDTTASRVYIVEGGHVSVRFCPMCFKKLKDWKI